MFRGGGGAKAKAGYAQMAEDLSSYEADLVAVEKELRQAFDLVHGTQGEARQVKLRQAASRLVHAKQLLQTLRLEVRELPDDDRAHWQASLAQHTGNIERYDKLLVALQNDERRQDLLEGRVVDADSLNPQQIIQHAAGLQEQSLTSLSRSVGMVEKSKQVGQDTAVKLHEQSEKLNQMDANIKDMNTHFEIARDHIRAIGKRVETDKFIMAMLLLVMVGILVIVVYKSFVPQSDFNVPKGFEAPVEYERRL